MFSYKDVTLPQLISLLQSSNLRYEDFSDVYEQPQVKDYRVYLVSLWQDYLFGRYRIQSQTVRIWPATYQADCGCSFFHMSRKLCWHVALVLYREQFYLDYEKWLLEQATGGKAEIAERLLELRQRYHSDDWGRHLISPDLKAKQESTEK